MYFFLALVAFLASLLTLFSGFGLGTLLTPVFGMFFPIQVVIAMTGIVHLANNLFKLRLLGAKASRDMVLKFGIPSVIGGLAGAMLLTYLGDIPALGQWSWGAKRYSIYAIKVVLAILMLFFAFMEVVPGLKHWSASNRYLSLGGVLSGFFGGLSGHQGALRSAFLVNAKLEKETFIATGVVIACLVDLTRLPVYFSRFGAQNLQEQGFLLILTCLSAFAGAWLGARYMQKVTLKAVQYFTTIFIVLIALLLGLGIL